MYFAVILESKMEWKSIYLTKSVIFLGFVLQALIVPGQCCKNIDLVLGIPNSLPPQQLLELKKAVKTFTSMFHVTNRFSHIGIVTYNDDANLYQPLDQDYSLENVYLTIDSIPASPSYGFNVAAALRVAADHAFTIYGGVRPSYSKVMVVFLPSTSTSSTMENQAAANKLKSIGVRLMVLGTEGNSSPFTYSTIVSEPLSEFLVLKRNWESILSSSSEISRSLCNKTAIKRCFIPFEMVIAIDNSNSLTPDEFDLIKVLSKKLMTSYANSENNAHFGLMTYESTPRKVTNGFRRFRSQNELYTLIDELPQSNDPRRRVDLVLKAAQKDFFSMEGGTRRGHPRYLLIVTSGGSSKVSESLRVFTKELDALGVQRIAVGLYSDERTVKFLQSLASENKLVFTANGKAIVPLDDIRRHMEPHICKEKPGLCPLPEVKDADACILPIPEGLIPCGPSADKSNQQQNDWDCPGELKCCFLDVASCHKVCRYPISDRVGTKDLLVLMENTDAIGGRRAFDLSKSFVQEFIGAFDVSTEGTHLSLATYARTVKTKFKFSDKASSENKDQALREIKDLEFQGGPPGNTTEALRVAHDLLHPRNSARYKMNKTVLMIGTGQVKHNYLAALYGSRVRSNLADVFAVTLGDTPNYKALRTIVSMPHDKSVFTVTSADAMKAQLGRIVEVASIGGKLMSFVGNFSFMSNYDCFFQ